MPEPTGAQIYKEPDAVLQLMAAGELGVSEETRALAQIELDHRAGLLERERLRTRPPNPEPDPDQPPRLEEQVRDLVLLGDYLTAEVDKANATLTELRDDVVALGRVFAAGVPLPLTSLPRLDEEDGA